ncbi:MAG TPA: helix-turn-helix transcriptional regulator [Ilumatobacteraceae bacterium]|jgi:DNA-binding PadR family transcriptional regulator|nr:helix-turn-helix transcriptional regulator [Ilumatobacteraceae bacterium]
MKGDDLRGHLEALVLAVLADGPAHGYGVIARLRERSGGQFDLAEGSLYPALHRLESAGQVIASWTEVQGRRRKIYEVTKSGAVELVSQRVRWTEFSTAMNQVLGGAIA